MLSMCNYSKGDYIYNQYRRMGISVDWKRSFFTVDDVILCNYSCIILFLFIETKQSSEGVFRAPT